MAWVLDLDGVVWLGDDPIGGSADAVAELQRAGETVAFVTNNSSTTRSEVVEKLAAHGIDAGDHVFTSAMAAATLLEPGERALVCAGPGVLEELRARGVFVVDAGDEGAEGTPVDAVVVGFHRSFDFRRMTIASSAARRGARLIGTNTDSTYPTPYGPIPGAGSILASIVTASGVRPEVAGKPFEPMAALVCSVLGGAGMVVGDRADTDGAFARRLGYRFGLVLSGITRRDDPPIDPPADLVADDLLAMVRATLSGPGASH